MAFGKFLVLIAAGWLNLGQAKHEPSISLMTARATTWRGDDMIKLVALLKARPGMSRGEFIERYEAVHAPLIGSLIPFFSAYRRSYPLRAVAPEHIEPPRLPESFDVLTELWYPGQAALDAQAKAIDGGAGTAIAQDEEEQFDRARMAMFVADERVTPASSLRPARNRLIPMIRSWLSIRPMARSSA